MRLTLDGHTMAYEAGSLCQMFFPGETVETLTEPFSRARATGDFVATQIKKQRTRACAFVLLSREGKTARAREFFALKDAENKSETWKYLGRAFYRAASKICGFQPPWGILTGVRPVKLFREKMAEGLGSDDATRLFEDKYFVSPKKAILCAETAEIEERIVRLSNPESFSLYVSIPFCPSRCAYCSFVSQSVEKAARLLPDYLTLLCREIHFTGEVAAALGLRLETVYIGGGTPTILEADQLKKLFAAIEESFTFSTLREYTVEAGRPDTVTPEKLRAIKDAGAGRISVNPQTMDEEILKAIGRKHTPRDILNAYAMARKVGIESINMDIIAGLPGDSPEIFQKTMDAVLALGPEAVTVHTLSMKKSSRLSKSVNAQYDAEGRAVSEMLDTAADMLHNAKYKPYYLYRQKNMRGNLENTGWSRPGREGLYNVFIMDETHTILAVGAGGVTKLRQPCGPRIERIMNFKYPYEYISRFGQVIDRKKQVIALYDEFSKSKN